MEHSAFEVEASRDSSPPLREFSEQTEVGSVFLQALVRRQLRLSLTVAGLFVVFLAIQPLISTLWPAWGDLKLAGIPLTWVVLGVGSYPLLVWLGRHYVHRAEEIDNEFADLLR